MATVPAILKIVAPLEEHIGPAYEWPQWLLDLATKDWLQVNDRLVLVLNLLGNVAPPSVTARHVAPRLRDKAACDEVASFFGARAVWLADRFNMIELASAALAAIGLGLRLKLTVASDVDSSLLGTADQGERELAQGLLALGINVAVIALAATVGLPLWLSVLSDSGGLLVVLANSLWPLTWRVGAVPGPPNNNGA